MKYNVNPSDYYPHLVGNPYPEFFDGTRSESPFKTGDVVFDKNRKCICIVLGKISLRDKTLLTDQHGVQHIDNLRHATLEDFEDFKYRTDEIHEKLFRVCCKQKGFSPMRFQVKATITKNMMVYVPLKGEMSEDEIIEAGREIAHEQFNPLNNEKYEEDSELILNLFD